MKKNKKITGKWAILERIEIYDDLGNVITDPKVEEGYDINGFPASKCVTGFYG